MLDSDEFLKFLLEGDFLWQNDTMHEAMLLCKTIYEKSPELRGEITNHILKGPPRKQYPDEESYKQDAELSIFRLLSYIESKDLPLTEVAREHLEEIKRRNPDLRLPKDADLPVPGVEVEWGRSEFTIEEILEKQPREVAKLLKEYEGTWKRSRRDLCEILGKACRRNSNWCLRLFREIKESVTELPDDSLNPVMWGLRSKEGGEEEAWGIGQVKKLFVLVEKLIDERPEAKFWDGVASLVQSWEKDLDLGLELWGNLTRRLSVIFATFDYERAEEDGPIEWIQRAINHPFGTLTELYLECANKAISSQAKAGEKYDLDAEIFRFFEYTTQNYAAGTRYGLCLLARHLGWLEAVVPDWTEKNLVQLFYRDNNRELTIVLWSGYLWGRTLSRHLSERFKDSYLHAATYYEEFAKQEREGFVVHVAGLAWFGNIQLGDLKEFIGFIDRKARCNLLHSWEKHLEKAEKDIAEEFWRKIILPYWDWCGQQGFLNLPDGNGERFSFWRLLPYSQAVFPEAKKNAVEWSPTGIEHVYLFPEKLAETDLAERFPEELVDLLTTFIKVDQHPNWHEDAWLRLWDSVKRRDLEIVSELRDELARKNVIAL